MSKATVAIACVAAVTLLGPSPTRAEPVRSLSPECETLLALSAAPQNLHAKSGVYLLGEEGFELSRPSENGFHCLVERNHPDSIIPQCFDAASKDANLAVILDEGKMLRRGKTFAELRAGRTEALDAGKYPVPGPGLVYMISDFNFIYNPARDAMLDVAPHVMYHAPNVSPADIGADRAVAMENWGLPVINAEGPHGFMIGFTEKGSGTADVERACKGQLPDTTGMLAFPPRKR